MTSKTTTTEERISRVGQHRQVVIPQEIFDRLRMQEGGFVAFMEKSDGVLIKAKRLVDDDTILTPEEAKIVRRGEGQLKRGKSKPWRDVKNVLTC